jgi:hypothetical protein
MIAATHHSFGHSADNVPGTSADIIQAFEFMASPAGLEPATHSLGNCCSIRLSYGDINGLNFEQLI